MNVLQIVTVVQIVPLTTAGGAHEALSTVQLWAVPTGPHRVTVLSMVTLVAVVQVATLVVMVNSTVAVIRNVALT
jgi:hypothetical protein